MSKTIWNPGDIITTEKWNRINNNASPILGAYQLPIEIGESFEMTGNSFLNSYKITINKSFEEIVDLLKQGIICYFFYFLDENSYQIALVSNFIDYDDEKSISFLNFNYFSTITFYPSQENSNIMINYNDQPEETIDR